jgi:adenylate cyclase
VDGIDALCDWLIDGAPGATTSLEVIEHLGQELCRAGIPLGRMSAFVTTLHPSILGRSFFWTPGQPVRVRELTRELQVSATYLHSPVAETMSRRVELRCRLSAGVGPTDYAIFHELVAQGYTDYLCLPMVFTTGQTHAISFATQRPRGFADSELAALRRVVRPLARIAEILALRRTAANLLSTYVGRNAGEHILAGRIYRGDLETIRAVIWFADLRGFTALSERLGSREIIDLLNELFECQVPAIERHGGEVLKFIGDGLLAIFPVAGDHAAPAEAALAAADDAFLALAQRNLTAAQPIEFGLALHVGEIAYGNIGSASRLDFTVIGAAVNLAARLEGLTGSLGRQLVVSQEFAQYATRPLVELGAFALKGVGETQRVFAPAGSG